MVKNYVIQTTKKFLNWLMMIPEKPRYRIVQTYNYFGLDDIHTVVQVYAYDRNGDTYHAGKYVLDEQGRVVELYSVMWLQPREANIQGRWNEYIVSKNGKT